MATSILSPSSFSSSDKAQRTLISTFINKIVLIHISDGRAFRGRFLCVDDTMNAILSDADELRLVEARKDSSKAETEEADGKGKGDSPEYSFRWVGMVMVPGEHIRAVEVESKAKDDQKPAPTHHPELSKESPTHFNEQMFF
ncbi:hypothetical protein CF319_g5092 [Tilletia indica]|uniref:Sm domain-containing protein n=1 Tax=Tilletia indica TaxID=43049 RepID=A0A177TDL2_9BASI|nr:hypothetical protein CF319_g5092 [Tilletia indica]KAE8259012.1 hypothetical protein A4X13_0g1292 [Tilletia indica]